MERYNYIEHLKEDINNFIEENKNLSFDELYDTMFTSDTITGNASGSYTFSTWKAEENIDEDIAEKTMNNMLTGKFTLVDMKNQFDMMNKMGPMQQVLNMIPGMGNKIPKEASKMTEDKIASYKIMMSSMTEEEMLNPKIIKQSRVQRIARGSGVSESEVKELLKYYNNTKKTMKGIGKRGGRLGGGAMNRMMGQFMNR